jgi:hypothetical protein
MAQTTRANRRYGSFSPDDFLELDQISRAETCGPPLPNQQDCVVPSEGHVPFHGRRYPATVNDVHFQLYLHPA